MTEPRTAAVIRVKREHALLWREERRDRPCAATAVERREEEIGRVLLPLSLPFSREKRAREAVDRAARCRFHPSEGRARAFVERREER